MALNNQSKKSGLLNKLHAEKGKQTVIAQNKVGVKKSKNSKGNLFYRNR
jgi:hypothetical protein